MIGLLVIPRAALLIAILVAAFVGFPVTHGRTLAATGQEVTAAGVGRMDQAYDVAQDEGWGHNAADSCTDVCCVSDGAAGCCPSGLVSEAIPPSWEGRCAVRPISSGDLHREAIPDALFRPPQLLG